MTKDELKKFDGKDGRPAYIAYNNVIYDVTNSALWENGSHMKRHQAGMDLTDILPAAPHNESVLQRLPVVGHLDGKSSPQALTADEMRMKKLRDWYAKIHPHPILIHFPMALIPFALLAQILFAFTNREFFHYTAFMALICAFLGAIPAIMAGFFSWAVNYNRMMDSRFKMKIIFSCILLVLLAVELYMASQAFFLETPQERWLKIAEQKTIFTVLLFLNFIAVSIIGYNGGRITWPHQ